MYKEKCVRGHEGGGVGQETETWGEDMCKSVGGSDRRREITGNQEVRLIMDNNYFTLELRPTQLERLESTADKQYTDYL